MHSSCDPPYVACEIDLQQAPYHNSAQIRNSEDALRDKYPGSLPLASDAAVGGYHAAAAGAPAANQAALRAHRDMTALPGAARRIAPPAHMRRVSRLPGRQHNGACATANSSRLSAGEAAEAASDLPVWEGHG